MAGAGSNDTRDRDAKTRRAGALGAHGVLVVTPYYNKPMDAGLVAHYAAIARRARLPDRRLQRAWPHRRATSRPPALDRIWEIAEVVALKESTGNLPRIAEIARTLPAGKTLLAGDDNVALARSPLGAAGLVSVMREPAPARDEGARRRGPARATSPRRSASTSGCVR